jgi:glutathione peroxidase
MSVTEEPMSTLADIPITTIDGESTSLGAYNGKVKELQKTYGERGFTVLGFPSNQFLQELSSTDAIKEYCSTTWGVTFPMMGKVRVNGRSEHPLYTELKKTADAEGTAGKVKWNFEKFVITPSGTVHRFRPAVEPDAPEIVDLIEASLPVR